MIYLHKILPVFVLPIGITLLLVAFGIGFRRRSLIWTGLVVLWLTSTPVVSGLAMRAAEGWAERGLAVDAPLADAIIVLSEGRIVAPGKAAVSEWSDADRFFGGFELFKAGKSLVLIFTGGAAPWEPNAAPEGDVLAEYAVQMGVPKEQVITTGRVMNTAEEAQAVGKILRARISGRIPRVLLVTSAYHMPRARHLFERAGMTVVSFPVDFKVPAGRNLSIQSFLPAASALQQTETAMRELYGRLYYSVVK